MKKLFVISVLLIACLLYVSSWTQVPDSGGMGTIRFIKLEDGQISWWALNPQSYESRLLQTFGEVLATEPAQWGDGQIVIFAVQHPTHPRLEGTVRGEAFHLPFPPNSNVQVMHPTLSRDGKLLAFTVRSSRHVGNVDIHDWSSGAYQSTYMAIGKWFKVVSVNLETGKEQAVYHDDALVPDIMKKRGLGPVFSPVEDILVYADNYRIYVCDAYSGQNLRTYETPSIASGGWTGRALISEYSGLAFHPGGEYVAYFSQGEAEIDINPSWIVLFNIQDGSSVYFALQDGISGGAPYGKICMDFSPDGRYLAFSVTVTDINNPILGLMDITTGETGYYNHLGKCFHPVWKGR